MMAFCNDIPIHLRESARRSKEAYALFKERQRSDIHYVGRLTSCSVTPSSCEEQGANLLILPTDVLKTISTLFRSKEWARGPSLTCRLLNKLSLPCIDVWAYLHLPLWKAPDGSSFYWEPPNKAKGSLRRAHMRAESAIKWAARRRHAHVPLGVFINAFSVLKDPEQLMYAGVGLIDAPHVSNYVLDMTAFEEAVATIQKPLAHVPYLPWVRICQLKDT